MKQEAATLGMELNCIIDTACGMIYPSSALNGHSSIVNRFCYLVRYISSGIPIGWYFLMMSYFPHSLLP
jgi:hypothetical protein